MTTPAPPPLPDLRTAPTLMPGPAPYKIKSSIILTRAPLLTRALSPFESAFFLYQKRLNERLSAPFVQQLYYKDETATALDWRIKLQERRGTAGKDIGYYRLRSGKRRARDEVLVGSTLGEQEAIRAALLADAEVRVSEDGERIPDAERVPVEPTQSRRTAADEKGDVRRLDRALDQTLYLVVQGQDGVWGFPTGDVYTSENLHEVCAA